MDSTIPGSLPAGIFAVEQDRKIRKTVEKFKLFEKAAKEISRRRYEKYMRLSLSAGCIRCTGQTYPALGEILNRCAHRFDVNVPELYIVNSSEISCRLIGEETPFILISTAALNTFNEEEMFALFAMQLSHIHCNHEPFLMATDLLNSAADNMGIFKSTLAPLRTLLSEWQQTASFSCDRGALLATGNIEPVISVLGKLAGCGIDKFGNAAPESLLTQYKSYKQIKDETPSCPVFKAWSNLYVGIPRYALRAGLLDEWSKTKSYQMLREGNVPDSAESTETSADEQPPLNEWGSFSSNNNAWETPDLSDEVIFGAAGIEHQLRKMFGNTGDLLEKSIKQGAGIAAQAAGSISDILGKFASK